MRFHLRTHNLIRLAEISGIYSMMKGEHRDFLADLTSFAVESRYGNYRGKLSEIIDKRTATHYFEKTKVIFLWLKKQIKK